MHITFPKLFGHIFSIELSLIDILSPSKKCNTFWKQGVLPFPLINQGHRIKR